MSVAQSCNGIGEHLQLVNILENHLRDKGVACIQPGSERANIARTHLASFHAGKWRVIGDLQPQGLHRPGVGGAPGRVGMALKRGD